MDVIPEYLKMGTAGQQSSYSSSLAVEKTAAQAAQKAQAKTQKADRASKAISSIGSTAAAVTGIAAAAGAANAVPVAGQIASAGLAIAGLLTKIFAGRRQKKKQRRAEAEARRQRFNESQFDNVAQAAEGGSGIGIGGSPGAIGATAPVVPPQTPTYSGWNGQQNPSVQPPQE